MALALPASPRLATLRAFGVVLALPAGVGAGLVAAGGAPVRGLAVALGVGGGLAVLAVAWPAAMRLPYRVWRRVTRLMARVISLYVLGVLHFLVLTAASRSGSSLALAPPGGAGSLWTPREPAAGVGAADGLVVLDSSGPGWAGGLASWARASGQGWACGLLPFLALLALLDDEPDAPDPPTTTYTLY
jgi:hypothetical protein